MRLCKNLAILVFASAMVFSNFVSASPSFDSLYFGQHNDVDIAHDGRLGAYAGSTGGAKPVSIKNRGTTENVARVAHRSHSVSKRPVGFWRPQPTRFVSRRAGFFRLRAKPQRAS